jgi:small subunit ribosomal protein S1
MENVTQEFSEKIDMEFVADSTIDEIGPGKIFKGEIVTIDSGFVYVNVGTKIDGRIPVEEFEEEPKIGDTVYVMLQNKRLVDGMYQFSQKSAMTELKWQKFLDWFNEGNATISGRIKNSISKGKLVDCNGVTAFLPFSLTADLKSVNESEEEYSFKVKSIDEKKRSVILSRKDFLDEESEEKWGNFLSKYKVGDRIVGEGIKYVEFGIFVRVEGIDALLHRNDMSWKKVFKQRKILKLGKEQEFVILDINPEEKKISLGLKQLTDDPWLKIDEKYKLDDQVSGKVVTLTGYGAFVEIEDGVEGFVGSADLSWTKNSINVKDVLQKGETYDFLVKDINKEERRVTLGYKQLLENPWDTIEERFPVGSKHTRPVKKIVKFGMFVELENDIDGLVHISDVSWDDNLKDVSTIYSVGDQVEIIILEVKKNEMKIACGTKQLTKSPWEVIREKYTAGMRVEGTVSGITPFGLFVKLEKNVEGLVHISEVSRKRIENLEDHFSIGDPVGAVVLDVDVDKKRLSLSIKKYDIATEKEELDKIMKETRPSTVTLGEIVDINLENK